MTSNTRSWVTRPIAAVAIACGGIALGMVGWSTDRLDAVQTRWDDLLQPGLGASEDPGVVVVAFDRDTLATLGTGWPVDRAVHADLVEAIGASRPAVIVYDVLFAEPREGDDRLASVLSATPTVIASALTLRHDDGPWVAIDAVRPAETLAASATAVAHANVTLATDTGIVRSMPIYAVDERGIVIPSMALAAVAVADGSATVPVERPDGIQIGDRRVPAPNGELAINWTGDLRGDHAIPAIDVLRGDVDAATFRDRIVLVGVTEPTLGDQHLVPIDRSGSTAGIMVIANAVNTIVSNGYLTAPDRGAELALIVGVGVLVALGFAFRRLTTATAITVVVLALMVTFASWRFHAAGEQWNVVWPVVTALLVAVSLSGWRYLVEIRHRHRAWALFATYVPSSVVAELADPVRLDRAVASTRSTVSVLFCDLRGFTPIAADLDPDDVRRLLDRYYDYAVAIIHAHRGTVMQFVGDEVFAVFGAPVSMDDDATAALTCAVELQDRVSELDATLMDIGLPTIRFGIGVHRGPVTTAHVGTDDRRQYSAIGDTVNQGSRLCGAAAPAEIVASYTAMELGDGSCDGVFQPGGSIPLKGVRDPVPIGRRAAT